LIWLRELRDQLRDRRTIFMIVVLPMFIYPAAGFGLFSFASSLRGKTSIVEVQGADNLPPPSPLPGVALLPLTPPPPGVPVGGAERAAGAVVLSRHPAAYPPLFVKDGDTYRFPTAYFESPETEAKTLEVRPSATALPEDDPSSPAFKENVARADLDNHRVDLLLVVPPGFKEDLDAGRQPKLFVLARPDDRSGLVKTRV